MKNQKKRQLAVALLTLTTLGSTSVLAQNLSSTTTKNYGQVTSTEKVKQSSLDVTLSAPSNLREDIITALSSEDPTSITSLTIHSSITFNINDWVTLSNLQELLPNIQSINLDTIETNIPGQLFAGRDWLVSFNDLSGSITTVRDGAFMSTSSLSSLSLPGALTIGENAFLKASVLNSVKLPAATAIGKQAFVGTTALKELALPSAISLGDSVFSSIPNGGVSSGLETIDLPKLQSLGNDTFSGAENLKEFNAPNVTSLGNYVFSGTALKSIVFKTELQNLSGGTFWDSNLQAILYATHEGGIDLSDISYSIPNNILTVGYTQILGKRGTIGQPLNLDLENNLLLNHLSESNLTLSSTWSKDGGAEISEPSLTHLIPIFQASDVGNYTPNLVVSSADGSTLEKLPLNTFAVFTD